MKSLLAISLTVLALAIAACGDDNDDNASTAGTSATTSEGNAKSKTTEDSKRKSRSGKSNRRSGSSGRSKRTTNSGKGAPTATSKNAGKSKQLYTQQDAEDVSSQLVAKRVCRSFLPNQTVRELKSGKTTKQKVAKSYSTGWPANKQDVAYKGCLQGLKAREE